MGVELAARHLDLRAESFLPLQPNVRYKLARTPSQVPSDRPLTPYLMRYHHDVISTPFPNLIPIPILSLATLISPHSRSPTMRNTARAFCRVGLFRLGRGGGVVHALLEIDGHAHE